MSSYVDKDGDDSDGLTVRKEGVGASEMVIAETEAEVPTNVLLPQNDNNQTSSSTTAPPSPPTTTPQTTTTTTASIHSLLPKASLGEILTLYEQYHILHRCKTYLLFVMACLKQSLRTTGD